VQLPYSQKHHLTEQKTGNEKDASKLIIAGDFDKSSMFIIFFRGFQQVGLLPALFFSDVLFIAFITL